MSAVARILRFRRRSDLLLAAIDVLLVVAVSLIAFRLRFEDAPSVPQQIVVKYRIATLVLAIIWILSGRAFGLYGRRAIRLGTSNLHAAFAASSVAGALLTASNYLAFGGQLSRAWMGLVTLGLLLGALATRGAVRRSRRALVPLGIALERYAVIGDDAHARRLAADLTRAPGAPFRVVAVLPQGPQPQEVAEQVTALRLDGLILPPGATAASASYAAYFSGSGLDVLLAPQLGDLDLRVASIAMLHGVPLLRVAGLAPRRRAIRGRSHGRLDRGVAVLGTRGVPANYGGFETFAERLALHLVSAGIETTVYCRTHYATRGSPWRGIRLVSLPTIRSKYLDTVTHTALSALHLVLTRGARDVVLCNAANAPVLLLLRLFRRRVLLNVDGLEWRRSKWGVAGRSWYRLGEWLSVRLASVLITDALEVQTYYRVRHDSDSVMIPYGADLLPRGSQPVPEQTPVAPDGFVLYVSRWERENNPVMVATAHARSGIELPLVMLGKATYDADLEYEVRAAAAPGCLMPGPLFGVGYTGLQVNARCYVHATEVGGTHPALIEALGAGNLVLVLDTPENREVAADAAVYFGDADDLAALLQWVTRLSAAELDQWRDRARNLASERYSWSAVCQSYLRLLGGT